MNTSSKKLIYQFIKFGIVGVVAAIVDVGLLMLLSEAINIDVMISSAISFSVSVVINYILSMKFVFKGRMQNKVKEFVIFACLSIGGLCINQGIMWIGIKFIKSRYITAKIFAMIFVPVYNFITRKIFLEIKER